MCQQRIGTVIHACRCCSVSKTEWNAHTNAAPRRKTTQRKIAKGHSRARNIQPHNNSLHMLATLNNTIRQLPCTRHNNEYTSLSCQANHPMQIYFKHSMDNKRLYMPLCNVHVQRRLELCKLNTTHNLRSIATLSIMATYILCRVHHHFSIELRRSTLKQCPCILVAMHQHTLAMQPCSHAIPYRGAMQCMVCAHGASIAACCILCCFSKHMPQLRASYVGSSRYGAWGCMDTCLIAHCYRAPLTNAVQCMVRGHRQSTALCLTSIRT